MCAPAPRRALAVRVLRGCRAYDDVARRMRATHEAVRAGAAPDALLLCEHAPTVTVGKRAARGEAHVKSSREALARAGIAFARADRGGDVTYHGPGQLTAYPVVSLRRARVGARAYVEGLERCVSEALRGLGIDARGGGAGREGVWVRDGKIAAVGVKISAGTSSHGVAINVDPDLTHFEHIVPCGLEGCEVTSVVKELGRAVAMRDVETRVVDAFAKRFSYADVFWSVEDE